MFVVSIIFGLAGCTTRLTDFTIISTKNVDLTRAADFERGKSRIEGVDKIYIIIFIPTGQPNMKEAIDRAIESVPGAVALLDGVLSIKNWYIPYIYGESSYVVEGTPLIDPKHASVDLKSNYMISRLDNNGNVSSFRYVSKEEYHAVREIYFKKK